MIDGVTESTDSGVFYDSGGSTGSIDSNEYIYTICPDTSGSLLVVEFIEFLTGPGELEIYDGADTSADLLFTFSGAIDGNVGPGTGQLITATDSNNSGCLTFRFSNGVPNNAFTGWEALISVREPCQTFAINIDTDIPVNEVGLGQIVTFTADVTPSSGVFSGLEYSWTFGDGNSATGQTVQNAFQNNVENTITLTITDEFGCSASKSIQITPIVRFIEVEGNTPYNVDRLDDDGNPETLTINNVNDLVIDILVDNDCANVSNISFTGNPNAPSIGYFDNNNSSFPIESGIIINNGNVTNAEGPNQGIQSDGGWDNSANSEPELSTFIPSISGSSNDESVLTFDFEAVSESLSFDFVFASEEYEDYQCNDTFADAFVFILTDQNGNQENLALVPETTDPISVTTVSPGTQTGCSPVNAEFFGEEYYGAVAPIAPIEYQGRTAVLTASTTINPGEVYNIKMIIADRGDSQYDSAIFLSAGSFELGSISNPTAASTQSFCESPTVADLVVTGENIQYYDAESDGNLLDETTSLTDGQTVYVTQTINNCESDAIAISIVVEDVEAPLPDNSQLELYEAGCNFELSTLPRPTATDNCEGSITAVLHSLSFPPGDETILVTWRYSDASGNFIDQSQLILTADSEAPVPALASLPELTAQCEVVNLTPPVATDNCDNGTIEGTTTTSVPVTETTTIEWVFEDSAGNSITQSQTIVIEEDTESPEILAESEVNLDLIDGLANLSVEMIDNGSSDNCSLEFQVLSQDSFSCDDLENQPLTISYTVTDSSGNSSSQDILINLTDSLDSCESLSINPTEAPLAIKLYPNPATHQVTLTSDHQADLKALSLYNMLGQKIKQLELSGSAAPIQIDVADLAAGNYFIQITTKNNNRMTKRFIKR
jgi:hypothetical protein